MPPRFTFAQRSAGILLHPTSLPGPHGSGDLGAEARHFVDFVAAAGLRWWQMLPTNPVGPNWSPYDARSAMAGNPWLIDPAQLVEAGWLGRRELSAAVRTLPRASDRIERHATQRVRQVCLRRAFAEFVAAKGLVSRAFQRFCAEAAPWLEAHALFMALRSRHGRWTTWPAALRRGQATALRAARARLSRAVEFERFCQYAFATQWAALRAYANQRGVGLIGDIPIFVAHDSSDVWDHQALFDLNADGSARTVSGVPPDLFTKDGQRWGHPQYRWPRHVHTRFAWWVARFARAFEQFDAVRIDHFLGFNRVWAVPGKAKTARGGRWVKSPGRALFAVVRQKLGPLAIIAEDLGLLIPEAARLRAACGFPGMRLMQFGFDGTSDYHLPHAYPRSSVVYAGTHDNDTTVGWFARLRAEHHQGRRGRTRRRELSEYERVLRYTGTDGNEIHWDFIRLGFLSPANTAIVTAQDVLGLDNRARMNTPGTTRGNWVWRLTAGQLTSKHAERLRALAQAYGRVRPSL